MALEKCTILPVPTPGEATRFHRDGGAVRGGQKYEGLPVRTAESVQETKSDLAVGNPSAPLPLMQPERFTALPVLRTMGLCVLVPPWEQRQGSNLCPSMKPARFATRPALRTTGLYVLVQPWEQEARQHPLLLGEAGEGNDSAGPTHGGATLTRSTVGARRKGRNEDTKPQAT